MKPYRMHIFICLGKRCSAKGSEELLETFKERVKDAGITGVRISKSGCLKLCKETATEGEFSPAVIVYPEGVWYSRVTISDVDEIIESHIKNGKPVERLVYYRMPR